MTLTSSAAGQSFRFRTMSLELTFRNQHPLPFLHQSPDCAYCSSLRNPRRPTDLQIPEALKTKLNPENGPLQKHLPKVGPKLQIRLKGIHGQQILIPAPCPSKSTPPQLFRARKPMLLTTDPRNFSPQPALWRVSTVHESKLNPSPPPQSPSVTLEGSMSFRSLEVNPESERVPRAPAKSYTHERRGETLAESSKRRGIEE